MIQSGFIGTGHMVRSHANSFKAIEGVELEASPKTQERFIRCIQTGKQNAPEFARGAKVQRLPSACFEADWKAQAIRL